MRAVHFASKVQEKSIPETMVSRILMFMWSLGPPILWPLQLLGLSTFAQRVRALSVPKLDPMVHYYGPLIQNPQTCRSGYKAWDVGLRVSNTEFGKP